MKTVTKKRGRRGLWLTVLALGFLVVVFYTKTPSLTSKVRGGGGQGDQCERFEPGRKLPQLSAEDKDYLVARAYQAARDFLAGKRPPQSFPGRFNGACNEVYVVFRVDGRLRGSASAARGNLADSAYAAARRILEEGRCDDNLKCYGIPTKSQLSELQAEVFVLDGGAAVVNRSRLYVPRLRVYDGEFEPGVHTIRLKHGQKTAAYVSDVAVVADIDTPKLVSRLCAVLELPESCAKMGDVDVIVYGTEHFMKLSPEGPVLDVYRANTLVGLENLTLRRVNESLQEMNRWLIENLNSEGYFTYKYYVGSGKYSDDNNMIRQLMASRVLAELAVNDSALAPLHRRNLEYVFSHWYFEEGDNGFIFYGNKSKLGAAAMAIRVIAQSPHFEEYRPQAEKLANTILSLQHEDGSFDAWFIEPDYEYDEERILTFYSGEAILSLVELYERTGDKRLLDAAVKSQEFYLHEYVDLMRDNYYPAYVPWHSMSLYRLYRVTGDGRYVDAVFRLNDELVKIQQTEKPLYLDTWGRFFNPAHPEFGFPHASSAGVYLEGLTYAYELAREANDTEHMRRYGRSIRLGALDTVTLQFREGNTYYLSHPERVLGAVRAGVVQNYIQVDSTQHNSDAFTRMVRVFSEEEFNGQNG